MAAKALLLAAHPVCGCVAAHPLALPLPLPWPLSRLQAWPLVGSAGVSAGAASYIDLKIEPSGFPVVAFRDGSGLLSLFGYDGTQWGGLEDATPTSVTHVSLAIGNDGLPAIAYSSLTDAGTVVRPNQGGTLATVCANNGVYSALTAWNSLALHSINNAPHIAFSNLADGGRLGFRFCPANQGSWGTRTPSSVGQVSYVSLAMDSSNAPAVGYVDAGTGQAHVIGWDPQGMAWVTLPPIPTVGAPSYLNLALDLDSAPVVLLSDAGRQSKASVYYFDPDTGQWKTLGPAGFTPGSATHLSLALGDLGGFVAFRDGSRGDKATVMGFDGTSWTLVGEGGFSVGAASDLSLAISVPRKSLYVAYRDEARGNKLTVHENRLQPTR